MRTNGLHSYEVGMPEPIAIVGMGCRLPADVNSPSELWQILRENRSGQCRIPSSRWNVDGFYNSNPETPGTLHHDGGYFINDDIRLFDNVFFGINSLEAISMDPQQRNLLEVVYQCLESAGARLEDVSGRNIGCYVGNFTTDYINISFKDPDSVTRYGATGIGTTVLSNRISHVFNLAGPSFVIDTACSSSIYALHNACLALQAGETDAALVCGTSLLTSPEQHIATVKAGVLSPTSTCHSFDESADGYGRAEGVGALYIKRLSDAIRDKDPIRSIIRGTALNCNGRTFGITLPSIEGQEAVIRKAYSKAGVPFGETDYVECHGTGTKVGDPIEVEALSRVFSKERQSPLLLGSLKPNFGHSEAASGIASIIKATIMLETAMIPPTYGLNKINPNIKVDEWNVQVVTQNVPWPEASLDKPRRVSINSFGYGGANAHAVLENVDSCWSHAVGFTDKEPKNSWTFILPFSAKTQDSLLRRVRSLVQQKSSTHALVDLAYTLGCRRSFFTARGFLLARPVSLVEDFQEKHLIFAQEHKDPVPLPLAMIFTGQGAQWPQMGLELLKENKFFCFKIRALDTHLQSLREAPAWTIEETLRAIKAESQIDHPSRSQPVCTAVQIALVDLLRQWRIVPQLVVGHSSGEIAASYAAGHITSHEAITIAYYRGLILTRSTFRGAMMVIAMSEREANAEINSAGLGAEIRVACKNSPESSTLSGNEDAVDTLLEKLTDSKVFARKLRTNGIAYHSYDMVNNGLAYQEFLSQYLQGYGSVKNDPSMPRMISSVTKKDIDATKTSHPSYWRANLESPVEFAEAISTALKDREYHFLELGPHSALELPLKQIHAHENVGASFLYASAIIRGKDSIKSLFNAVGKLFIFGHNVDFGRINTIPRDDGTLSDIPNGRVLTELPRYPWDHDLILWNESRMSTEYRFRKHSRHDLLGSIIPGGSTRSTVWRNLVGLKHVPWLADHKLEENIVFPAAAYLAMAVEALSRILHPLPTSSRISFRSVKSLNALIIPINNDTTVELITEFNKCSLSQALDSNIWYQFEISSVADNASTRHATGLVSAKSKEASAINQDAGQYDRDLEQVDPKRWYGQLATRGLRYGPRFQLIHRMQAHRSRSQQIFKSEILASGSEESGSHKESKYALHPSIIDALLQTGLMADSSGHIEQLRAGLPVSLEALTLTVSQPTWPLNVFATASQVGFGTILFDIVLRDAKSCFVASMQGVRMTEYVAVQPDARLLRQNLILDLVWKPDVEYLQPSSLQAYMEYIEHEARFSGIGEIRKSVKHLIGILDLIMHKKPACRVLNINVPSPAQDKFGDAIRTISGHQLTYRRCETYAQGRLEANGIIRAIDCNNVDQDQDPQLPLKQDKFDVIVFQDSRAVKLWLENSPHQIQTLLIDNAWIMCLEDCEAQMVVGSFDVILNHQQSLHPFTIARLHKHGFTPGSQASGQMIFVTPNEQSPAIEHITKSFAAIASTPVLEVKLAKVDSETIYSGATVIALVEIEKPLFSNLDLKEMQAIKTINEKARTVLWLMGSDLMRAAKPDMSITLGFFRTMRIEHYPTKFGILDIDQFKTSGELIGQRIADLLIALEAQPRGDDEFVLRNGLLHISRMVPQTTVHSSFACTRDQKKTKISRSKLGAAQLVVQRPGNIGTICLQQHLWAHHRMQEDEIEVEVLAVGLNAKDLYTLMGRVDTRGSTSLLECVGTVRAVGHKVSTISSGDRVVVMAPQKFSSLMRVPQSCCCKLLAHENSLEMATVPLVLSSAIYALRHRAHLQRNESVLIHSATGGLGQAAIQIARLVGAEIFATAGTEERRRYLHDVLGVAQNNIFDSHDTSFVADVIRETKGRGVDVVLNSLSGDLLHGSWRCMADFGRFIEVGKKDIGEAGNLDMSVFSRATNFSAFDLIDFYYSKNSTQNSI